MTAARRLMVFGKMPEPGRVKTRLEPAVGADGAVRLYRAFLDDLLSSCRDVEAERELWLDRRPEDGGAAAAAAELRVRRQPRGGLGERLRTAFSTAFGEGVRRALVVGSDHPTLPPARMREALAALDDADASLGPTADGGYWAVGLRRAAWPRAAALFEDIPWSTGEVLRATLARAEEHDLRVRRVGGWYDVDEPGDLDRLRRDVRPGSATAAALVELGLDGDG